MGFPGLGPGALSFLSGVCLMILLIHARFVCFCFIFFKKKKKEKPLVRRKREGVDKRWLTNVKREREESHQSG